MKKIILVFLFMAVILGMGVQAMAQPMPDNARLDSMSADARQVGDINLIFLYPNKVLEYKNTVDFRLGMLFGGGTQEWGGCLMDLGEDFGVLGTYVNRYSVAGNKFMGVVYFPSLVALDWEPAGGIVGPMSSSNIIDLFWAKPIGGADLGLHFNYGEDLVGQTENFGLSAGLGFANMGVFSEGNIHLDYRMENATAGAIKDKGIYTIAIGTLWQAPLDSVNDIRLFGDFALDQAKMAADDAGDIQIDLGSSLNQKISGGKGLVSTGLILDYFGLKDNAGGEVIDNWALVWNGALEAQVANWLTLRSGIAKAIVTRMYDSMPSPGDPTYRNSGSTGVEYSAGFGINWQNWTLDASVDITSLENSIQHAQPGRGLLFVGDMMTVSVADLRYKF